MFPPILLLLFPAILLQYYCFQLSCYYCFQLSFCNCFHLSCYYVSIYPATIVSNYVVPSGFHLPCYDSFHLKFYFPVSIYPSMATLSTYHAIAPVSMQPSMATVSTYPAIAPVSMQPSMATVSTYPAIAPVSMQPSMATVSTYHALHLSSLASVSKYPSTACPCALLLLYCVHCPAILLAPVSPPLL
jgi:hypothetical protein